MNRILTRVSNGLAVCACLALVAVMPITFVDVIGRYFFNAPVTFAVELIQLGVGLVVLLGLAVTTLERGHIAVDLLDRVVPPVVQAFLTRFAALCGTVFIALIGWRLWDRAMNFRADGLATDILFLPVWPVVALMALAAWVAAIVALTQIIRPGAARSETDHMREYD